MWSELFALPDGDLVVVGGIETEADARAFADRIHETGLASAQGTVRQMTPTAFEQMLVASGGRVVTGAGR